MHAISHQRHLTIVVADYKMVLTFGILLCELG